MTENKTNKNKFTTHTLALTLGVVVLAAGFVSAKPNLVLLIADDCTRWDLGCYGSKDSRTPTIDMLAGQGMLFTNCHQAAPMCSPTRQNLYTGMFPTRNGAYPNHTFVYDTIKSVVQRLKPFGYRVALAGKRHIGPGSVFSFEYLDNESAGPEFALIDTFVASAVTKKQPFCLFICSHLPHSPWTLGDQSKFNANTLTLPPGFLDNAATRTNFRNYLAEINALDSQVQKSLAIIDKYKIADSTVFVFTSEQGTSQPFAKWTCYNAGLGSALIVRWPGVAAAGSKSGALVEYSDILPTFIDIAGGQPVTGLDGSSIVPVLRGQTTTHKEFSYAEMTTRGIISGADYYPIRSVYDGRFRLIRNFAPDVSFECAAERPNWEAAAASNPNAAKLVNRFHYRPPVELFDESRDPWDTVNLADTVKYDSVKTVLMGKLQEWLTYTNDDVMHTEIMAFDRMDVVPRNRDSVVVIETLSPATKLKNTGAGVSFALYNGTWTRMPDFAKLTPARTGTIANCNGPAALPGKTGNTYAVRYTGYVHIAFKRYYTFYLNSFNEAGLWIDGNFIVGTSANQTAKVPARRYGAILVDTGMHAIELQFLGNSVKDSISLAWSHPPLKAQDGDLIIPASEFQYGESIVAVNTAGTIRISGGAWKVRGNRLSFCTAGVKGDIRIFNTQGELVFSARNATEVNLSHLSPGLYVIKARTAGKTVSGRIIKG